MNDLVAVSETEVAILSHDGVFKLVSFNPLNKKVVCSSKFKMRLFGYRYERTITLTHTKRKTNDYFAVNSWNKDEFLASRLFLLKRSTGKRMTELLNIIDVYDQRVGQFYCMTFIRPKSSSFKSKNKKSSENLDQNRKDDFLYLGCLSNQTNVLLQHYALRIETGTIKKLEQLGETSIKIAHSVCLVGNSSLTGFYLPKNEQSYFEVKYCFDQ